MDLIQANGKDEEGRVGENSARNLFRDSEYLTLSQTVVLYNPC